MAFRSRPGHTTTATVGYLLIAWLLSKHWPSKRTELITGAGLIATAVGLSRV
jgi:membrane-associated phospholipid phosphatase